MVVYLSVPIFKSQNLNIYKIKVFKKRNLILILKKNSIINNTEASEFQM